MVRKNHIVSTIFFIIQAAVAFSHFSTKGGISEMYKPEPVNSSPMARVCTRSFSLCCFEYRKAKSVSDAAPADMSFFLRERNPHCNNLCVQVSIVCCFGTIVASPDVSSNSSNVSSSLQVMPLNHNSILF